MLAHRLRRWPNIETALGEYPVFAGKSTLGLVFTSILRMIWIIIIHWILSSKHEALNQCLFNVGTESETMGQHQIDIGSVSRVCWVATPKTRHIL